MSADVSSVLSMFAQRVVVGVGDMAVSNSTGVVLSTYALGSCIGVVAYDPVVKVGGILHLMLPESKISPDKAESQPAMFADTGLPLFFRQMTGFKAMTGRMRLFVAGGASVLSGVDPFAIGARNTRATLEYLKSQGFAVRRTEVGGNINRTIHLEMASGNVSLKTPAGNAQLSLAT
jgi:chemotaxis protein CheD